MNLTDMLQEINAALDYNPDLKQYEDATIRRINRHYLQISSQYPWLFMQKRQKIQLRADIHGDSTSTLTGFGTLTVALPRTTGIGVKNLPADIVGATLINNDDGSEYKITAFVDERKFVVDNIFPTGTISNWTIKFVEYLMPRDCIEVLGLMDRGIKTKETLTFQDGGPADTQTTTMTAPNRGRIMFLDARKEENLYLDRADTGDPFVSIEEMHNNLPAPTQLPIGYMGFSDEISTDHGHPHPSSGRFASGAPYFIEYCYTFVYAGDEGPPSEIIRLEVRDPDDGRFFRSVDLRSFPDTTDRRFIDAGDSESGRTGRLKKLYRRYVFDEGDNIATRIRTFGHMHDGKGNQWRHIATLSESDLTYNDFGKERIVATVKETGTTSATGFVTITGEILSQEELFESGPRKRLRFWNTPNKDYMIEARYHRRPHRLVAKSDAPQWPPQYHHYLVYAALRDICMQHGMLNHSTLYERRADEMLEAMKAKYLSRIDRMYVRRGFDRAMADRERFGIPSKAE